MADDARDVLFLVQLLRECVTSALMYGVELSGRPRREVYARALALARHSQAGEADGQD